ncbi:hypothetical protein CDV31_007803 [Fusarium ambrosium]|uniref:Uncharacterized protein n=1 Tax=Fusarium ambrosium TaxID=131363 RepID=A0A428U4M2_9HYPO|nr:hypothetical protein CDV31_007803 [Fusarium ambrosium]
MPSPTFRPDLLKLMGWENWDLLSDRAIAELVRRCQIRRERAEARMAGFVQGREPLISNGGVNARVDDNNAKFNMDDQKDFGLRKLFANQDDEDGACSSDSATDSDSSMDDEDEDQESEDSDEGDEEEDSGYHSYDDEDEEDSEYDSFGDDDDDEEDEEDSSEEDDGSDNKAQL